MSFPRYPKYKDSGVKWLGKVPAHWEIKALKHVSSYNDAVLPESTPEDYVIQYVEISDVNEHSGIIGWSDQTFSSAPSRARRILRDGDVLISTVRTYLRAIAPVSDPPENLIASTGFAVIRPLKGLYCSSLLGYVLRAEWFISNVIARSVGVSYPAINASELVALHVPFPPWAEQKEIAAFLDHETARIDALVQEQQRLIKLLMEKRQAVISHAVTKGLNPDVPMKDSGVEWLGEVPAHWDVRKASYIGRLFGSDNVPEDMVSDEGDTPYLKVGSLSTESLEVADWAWYVDPSISGSYRACDHYVVFPKRGAAIFLNKVNVVSCPALIDPNLMGWEIEGRHSSWYFAYSLKLRKLDELADVSTVPQINNKHIGPERFPVPPIEEQEEIASYLKKSLGSIDELVATSASVVKLLQERRSALISAAVTGKIDVRSWQPPPGSSSPAEATATEPA